MKEKVTYSRFIRICSLVILINLFYSICFAEQTKKLNYQVKSVKDKEKDGQQSSSSPVIVTVDMSVLFTFHPAMRDFDYISGKFVSQKPYTPPKGGKAAWERLKEKREKIEKLETELEIQLSKANSEIFNNNPQRGEDLQASDNGKLKGDDEAKSDDMWKEYNKYLELVQEHRRLLIEVAAEVLGGFPESLLGDLPEKELERIASEIYKEIEEVAKQENADIVLNLPTYNIFYQENQDLKKVQTKSQDILNVMNIRSLKDIEYLLLASEKSQELPIGKEIPKGNPNYRCGGHFESVTDYEHMRALIEQYFGARNKFTVPFERFGAKKTVLKGKVLFQEKDITIQVLEKIFDLYKTRELERRTIISFLKGIRG